MKRIGLPLLLSATLAVGGIAGCGATSTAGQSSQEASSVAASAVVAESAESGSTDSQLASQETESQESGSAASAESAPEATGSNASAVSANAGGETSQATEGSSESSASQETQAPSGSPSSGQQKMAGNLAGAQNEAQSGAAVTTSANATRTLPSTDEEFTDRDLEQTADTTDAKQITVSDGQDVSITEEGVYVLSGSAKDCTVTVDADDTAKVQIVLDGLTIENEDSAAIYVVSADKVFVTTAEGSTNTLKTTGEFTAVGDENVDAVVYSKDDVVFNGKGTLVIESSNNGIEGNDDVKFTGGTYQITASNHGVKGKDSLAIADGSFTIDAGKDALHADNSDDQTLGYVYISDGSFDLKAASDGIEGDAFVKIDGGTFTIDAQEGIEGSHVQVNDGTIGIKSSDDAINATAKSSEYAVILEINGGALTIEMASGDTDALDSNGDLIINGGTVDITGQFAFDFTGSGELNGGTVTVNGEQVTELANSMMDGGFGGGFGGNPGDGQQPGADGMSGQGTPPDWGERSGEGPRGMGGQGHGPRPDMGTQQGEGLPGTLQDGSNESAGTENQVDA